jgi:hypothetical protein
MDQPEETDEGYVTLVNASIESDGSIKESDARTGIWAWKHPHSDGTVTYTKLAGHVLLDDVDFGYKSTVKDFEENIVQTLPIYYIKMKEGENMNDLSTDITSTLAAYASMANDFNEMNRVIDVLELGRDLLKERKITQTQGDKPLMESFKAVGRKVEKVLTKSGDGTRFMERLNDFFDM